MDKELVPELRFEGFEEPWEEKKLGDFGYVAMNKRVFKEQTNETGDVPFFKIGTFGKSPDAYITRELFEDYKKRYPYPKVGTLLISAAGSIGRTVQYAGEDAYYQDSNIVWLEHNELLDDSFLKVFYDSCKWSTLEGTTLKRLYNKDILSADIDIPIVQEQKALGEAFYNLDSLIAEQEKKCAALGAARDSLLDKMFPKEGETEPELRFDGFSGPWERVKLGEVASFGTGNGLCWDDVTDSGAYECILYGNLYTHYGMINDTVSFKTDMLPRSAVLSRYGDVLIPNSDTTPTGLARATCIEKDGVLLGGGINILRPHEGIDGGCLSIAINANKAELIKLIKGTTVRHIHNSDIATVVLAIPPNIEEQESISKTFKALSESIAYSEKELSVFKKIKGAMLDKMFPKGAR